MVFHWDINILPCHGIQVKGTDVTAMLMPDYTIQVDYDAESLFEIDFALAFSIWVLELTW